MKQNKTETLSIIFNDIDWTQPKEMSGLVDDKGKQVFGGQYIPVENMNKKTTELLNQIATSQTPNPVSYGSKPDKERWMAEKLIWTVNPQIAQKYQATFEIEQGSLYYRGTWLQITVKKPDATSETLQQILNKFCADFGFDQRKEISFILPYDLPWPEGQKQREDEDNRTDYFFDSMDD